MLESQYEYIWTFGSSKQREKTSRIPMILPNTLKTLTKHAYVLCGRCGTTPKHISNVGLSLNYLINLSKL
ncbi:hypothetical protein [Candidatus Hodgkinia cicadicola]|uniref:hypothetical protein n=1 Tax=Candidatus Hodgkinia cicadicola TaxID=573658 RepID=UPI0011BA8EC1